MSDVELARQLNRTIDAILAGRSPGVSDSRISETVAIAAALRGLPRAQFKLRLKEELENEVSMSASAQTKRTDKAAAGSAGWRSVTPYMIVSDIHQEIEFIKKVFGAKGKVYGLGSQGGYHSEYRIGDSFLMIGGGGKGSKWKRTPVPMALHVYVENTDDVYRRAMEAGATSLVPPTDMVYGERSAAIEDVGGNHWYLATTFGKRYVPKGLPNLMPVFHPRGAKRMIDFLESAFAAKPLAVHQTRKGVVKHAQIRLGDSVLEMGEAHGQWQPRPMHFMLNVADCDTAYEQAMKAEGAISVSAPANAPYGGRTGTIQDPFGNTWYLNSAKQKKDAQRKTQRSKSMTSAKLFRIALQVGDLDQAAGFYSELLDDAGIRIARGSRHYFDCGEVILALVDVTAGGEQPQPAPDYIYFAVKNLDEVFARAQALQCLAKDRFHDQNAGEIVKRPWGELSFYCEDPWGNGLCFVDENTLFTGK